MAKDKRSKGCPNAECVRNQKKYHYKVTDQFCTMCGSELVLVCQDCFQKLADLGPKHVRCNSCAAEREDRKHRPEKRIKHIAGEASDFAKDAAKQAKDLGAGLLDGVKDFAQQAREKAEMPRKKQQITDSIEQEDSGEQDEANSLPD